MSEYFEKFRNLTQVMYSLGDSDINQPILEIKMYLESKTDLLINTKIPTELLQVQKKNPTLNSTELTSTLFNHLYLFFNRFFCAGDIFQSKRFSLNSQYSIPYLGEELMFYWPTRDHYYIKSPQNNQKNRNAFDYFIHKNLKKFLEKELLDYVNNSYLSPLSNILHDIGNKDEIHSQQVILSLFWKYSHEFIDLILIWNNFMKLVWEKKKLILQTHYLMSIQLIPVQLYPQIEQNQKQQEEWETLFHLKWDQKESFQTWVKQYPFLPIDTNFFDISFKEAILNQIDDLDGSINGYLIKSDNFSALSLLNTKWADSVKVIYIDPPYNTGTDEFKYKDNYRHATWLTMMMNRLELAKPLLSPKGILFSSIDDNEQPMLSILLKETIGNVLPMIVWQKKTQPSYLTKELISVTEYILGAKKTAEPLELIGSYGDKDKLTELINLANNYSDRILAKNHVIIGEKFSGTLIAGEYGKGDLIIHLLKPVTVKEGRPTTNLELNARFKWTQTKIDEELAQGGTIYIKSVKSLRPTIARIYDHDIIKAPTTLLAKNFNGIPTNTDGNTELKALFNIAPFDYPKPTGLIEYLVQIATPEKTGLILDFFGGSGTTGQAVIQLNLKDQGRRKFCLIEAGDHFDSIIIPRMKKIMFANEWKDGIPQKSPGNLLMLQYQTLESFKDALQNVQLDFHTNLDIIQDITSGSSIMQFFKTILKNSATFLNIGLLEDPMTYSYKMTQGDYPDIIMSFNALLGIHIQRFHSFFDQNRKYYYVFGFSNKNKERILIIWRSIKNIDLKQDKECIELKILSKFTYDRLFINGLHCVPNGKVTEEVMQRLICNEI